MVLCWTTQSLIWKQKRERPCLQRITFSEIINLEGKAYAEWTYGFKKEAGDHNVRSVYWLCLVICEGLKKEIRSGKNLPVYCRNKGNYRNLRSSCLEEKNNHFPLCLHRGNVGFYKDFMQQTWEDCSFRKSNSRQRPNEEWAIFLCLSR